MSNFDTNIKKAETTQHNKVWERIWGNCKPYIYKNPAHEAHPIFRKYLPKNNQLRALEIGCGGGYWLVYFHKEFNYQVEGVEFSDGIILAEKTCKVNNVPVKLYREDIFSIQLPYLYDVIISDGFLEHYDNYIDAFETHFRWLKPGGYLVMSVPNIRYIHKILFKWVDPDFYYTHKGHLVNPHVIRRILEERGFMILFLNYWTTWRPHYCLPKILDFFSRAIIKSLRMVGLSNIPNKYFSPMIWCVAKKN